MTMAATTRPGRHPALARPLDELAVELTGYCNLQCRMCSVWEGRRHGVPFALACQLLADAHALGARRFTPCGAECFMRKDFLDLVEHAHRLGYKAQDIVTNGTMVTDAHLDRLAACPSVGLNISIDGPRHLHDDLRGDGNYDKSVACARKCVERRIIVGLSGVILRESLATLPHLVDLAAELGVPSVSFQPFQTEISGLHKDVARFSLLYAEKRAVEDALARLLEHAARKGVRIYTGPMFGAIPDYLVLGKRPIPRGGCHLPSKMLLVDLSGEVYPCFFMRRPFDRMGNVYRDPLASIWHSPPHEALQMLALTERCPGSLAACSDVESFAQAPAR